MEMWATASKYSIVNILRDVYTKHRPFTGNCTVCICIAANAAISTSNRWLVINKLKTAAGIQLSLRQHVLVGI
jgi:hypothetical protein